MTLFARSPFGVWPAVLCAKSLRRSGEVALFHGFYSLLGSAAGRDAWSRLGSGAETVAETMLTSRPWTNQS